MHFQTSLTHLYKWIATASVFKKSLSPSIWNLCFQHSESLRCYRERRASDILNFSHTTSFIEVLYLHPRIYRNNQSIFQRPTPFRILKFSKSLHRNTNLLYRIGRWRKSSLFRIRKRKLKFPLRGSIPRRSARNLLPEKKENVGAIEMKEISQSCVEQHLNF